MEEGGTERRAAFVAAIRAPPHLSISLETLPHPLAQYAWRWKVRLNAGVGKEVQQQAEGAVVVGADQEIHTVTESWYIVLFADEMPCGH